MANFILITGTAGRSVFSINDLIRFLNKVKIELMNINAQTYLQYKIKALKDVTRVFMYVVECFLLRVGVFFWPK